MGKLLHLSFTKTAFLLFLVGTLIQGCLIKKKPKVCVNENITSRSYIINATLLTGVKKDTPSVKLTLFHPNGIGHILFDKKMVSTFGAKPDYISTSGVYRMNAVLTHKDGTTEKNDFKFELSGKERDVRVFFSIGAPQNPKEGESVFNVNCSVYRYFKLPNDIVVNVLKAPNSVVDTFTYEICNNRKEELNGHPYSGLPGCNVLWHPINRSWSTNKCRSELISEVTKHRAFLPGDCRTFSVIPCKIWEKRDGPFRYEVLFRAKESYTVPDTIITTEKSSWNFTRTSLYAYKNGFH